MRNVITDALKQDILSEQYTRAELAKKHQFEPSTISRVKLQLERETGRSIKFVANNTWRKQNENAWRNIKWRKDE